MATMTRRALKAIGRAGRAVASTFSQWARNGRLATIGLAVIFITWLGFQIWVQPPDRPPILDQMLYTMAGVWMGNIAMAQGKKEDAEKKPEDN